MPYMFRTLFASIIRSLQTVTAATGVCRELGWNKSCIADLEHLYRIYSVPTHDKHQWLLLQLIVLMMMEAKSVRNM